MKRALAISVIALVAVIMGISAVAPVMTYVDASHGEPLPEEACVALRNIPDPQPKLAEFIAEHCGCFPPDPCGGGGGDAVKDTIT